MVFAMSQIIDNDNATPATELITAGWTASRTSAMQEYVEANTPYRLEHNKKAGTVGFKKDQSVDTKPAMPVDADGAIIPWNVFSKQGQAKPYDPDAVAENLIKTLEGVLSGKSKKTLVDGGKEEAVRLLSYLKGFRDHAEVVFEEVVEEVKKAA